MVQILDLKKRDIKFNLTFWHSVCLCVYEYVCNAVLGAFSDWFAWNLAHGSTLQLGKLFGNHIVVILCSLVTMFWSQCYIICKMSIIFVPKQLLPSTKSIIQGTTGYFGVCWPNWITYFLFLTMFVHPHSWHVLNKKGISSNHVKKGQPNQHHKMLNTLFLLKKLFSAIFWS